MASTYSTNLKIELQATGENSGTWGTITNTNLGTALEQAIVGYGNPNYASDANLTLTYTDTNAAQAARALVLNVTSTGSLSATRELVVPTIQKQYIVQNNTSGSQSITVKTSAGTGITVPNGRKAHLYVDGTNVIYMDDYVDINGGAIDGTPIGANSASTGAFTTLSASGNLTFSSTAQRITGDMSNATLANRLLFQNSVTNGNTNVAAIPNGTGTVSAFRGYGASDPTNANAISIAQIGTTEARISSEIFGTASYLPMTFYTGGSERMRLDTSGNLGIGATPSYRLDVQGGTASFTGSSGANAIRVAGAGGSWFWIDNPTTTTMRFSSGATAGTGAMVLDSSGNVGIGTASPASKLDVSGIIRDSAGNVRAIPPVGTKTGSYTLATGDVGKYVQVGTSGSITIPDATFAEGDVISIFNNTTGNVTLTCSITTAYIAGTDTDKATMTLATRGVATVLFISSTVCVVSGNVS